MKVFNGFGIPVLKGGEDVKPATPFHIRETEAQAESPDTDLNIGNSTLATDAAITEDADSTQSQVFGFNEMIFQACANLPTGSPEYAQAIQSLKPQFESRTQYNCMVADSLAMRGISPNSKNVLEVGRWGSAGFVKADVNAWYATLAAKLSANHANIPEGLKRGANHLIEQMWSMAIDASTSLLKQASEQLADTQTRLQELTRIHEKLESSAAKRHAQAVADLQAKENDLNQSQNMVASLQATITELTASIAQNAMDWRREKELWAMEKVRLEHNELNLLNSSTALTAQVKALQDSSLALQQRQVVLEETIAQERSRLDANTRANALATDGFRQDIKDGAKRLDDAYVQINEARSQLAECKDELARETIASAKVAQELAAALAALEADKVVSDGVWEALQRLIENAESLGTASKEDALVVARWRGRFRNAG